MKYHIEQARFERFETDNEIVIPISFIPELGELSSAYFRSGKYQERATVEKHLQPGSLFECAGKTCDQRYRVLVLGHILHETGTEVLFVIDDMSDGVVKRSYDVFSYRDPLSGERGHATTVFPEKDLLGSAAEALCQKLGLMNLFILNRNT